MSIVEIVTILLSLTDFGIQPSPQPIPPADAIRLAPERPDVAAHVDFGAFVPNNHRALTTLASKLRAGTEERITIDKALAGIEAGRAAAKVATGVDPVADLSSATGFATFGAGDPRFLIVVRGRFPPDLFDRAGGLASLADATRLQVDGRAGVARGRSPPRSWAPRS
jgi:hypothetical protein